MESGNASMTSGKSAAQTTEIWSAAHAPSSAAHDDDDFAAFAAAERPIPNPIEQFDADPFADAYGGMAATTVSDTRTRSDPSISASLAGSNNKNILGSPKLLSFSPVASPRTSSLSSLPPSVMKPYSPKDDPFAGILPSPIQDRELLSFSPLGLSKSAPTSASSSFSNKFSLDNGSNPAPSSASASVNITTSTTTASSAIGSANDLNTVSSTTDEEKKVPPSFLPLPPPPGSSLSASSASMSSSMSSSFSAMSTGQLLSFSPVASISNPTFGESSASNPSFFANDDLFSLDAELLAPPPPSSSSSAPASLYGSFVLQSESTTTDVEGNYDACDSAEVDIASTLDPFSGGIPLAQEGTGSEEEPAFPVEAEQTNSSSFDDQWENEFAIPDAIKVEESITAANVGEKVTMEPSESSSFSHFDFISLNPSASASEDAESDPQDAQSEGYEPVQGDVVSMDPQARVDSNSLELYEVTKSTCIGDEKSKDAALTREAVDSLERGNSGDVAYVKDQECHSIDDTPISKEDDYDSFNTSHPAESFHADNDSRDFTSQATPQENTVVLEDEFGGFTQNDKPSDTATTYTREATFEQQGIEFDEFESDASTDTSKQSPQTEIISATPNIDPSTQVGDDFGDFTQSSTAPVIAEASEFDENFGDFAQSSNTFEPDDDFGDFTQSADKNDGFDDFDDFQQSSSTFDAQAEGDADDGFGDFTPSTAPLPVSITTSAPPVPVAAASSPQDLVDFFSQAFPVPPVTSPLGYLSTTSQQRSSELFSEKKCGQSTQALAETFCTELEEYISRVLKSSIATEYSVATAETDHIESRTVSLKHLKYVLLEKIQEASRMNGIFSHGSDKHQSYLAVANSEEEERMREALAELQHALLHHSINDAMMRIAKQAALSAKAKIAEQAAQQQASSRGGSLLATTRQLLSRGGGHSSTNTGTGVGSGVSNEKDHTGASASSTAGGGSGSLGVLTPTGASVHKISRFALNGKDGHDDGTGSHGSGSDNETGTETSGDFGRTSRGNSGSSEADFVGSAARASASSNSSGGGLMKKFSDRFSFSGSRNRTRTVNLRRMGQSGEEVRTMELNMDQISGGFDEVKWKCAMFLYDVEEVAHVAPSQINIFAYPSKQLLSSRTDRSALVKFLKPGTIWTIDIGANSSDVFE